MVLIVASALSLAALPASASAAQRTFVQVGPLRVHGGWDVTLSDAACGAKRASDFSVTFTKGSATTFAEHDYTSKAVPECRVAKTLGAASVNVKWGKVLDLSVQLAKPGKLHAGGRAPVGCTGHFGEERTGLASGRIDLAIHTGAFGRLTARSAPVEVATSGTVNCKPAKVANAYTLAATFASSTIFLDASETTNGKNPLVFISNTAADTPARDVSGSYLLVLGGRASVSIAAPNATVNGLRGFTTGELRFTGQTACTNTPNAYNGTFVGTLTVTDPVFGNFALTGAHAQDPSLGLNSAQPGTCNGPLYQPVSPLLANECSTAGSCSLSAGTGTDTFNDGTTAGGNTITSESINFGDGSPPVTITPGGSVSHTYTKAGAYTATLSITYTINDGGTATHTATTRSPVNIGA